MRVRNLSIAGTAAVDMATHWAMTETCLQAVAHIAELETISWLCMKLAIAAMLLKIQLLLIHDAGYQLQ